MSVIAHDCAHHGHIWREPDGSLYRRHRGRPNETVDVTCDHCHATAELPMYGQHTSPAIFAQSSRPGSVSR